MLDRIRVFIVGGCLIAAVAAVPTNPGLAAPPVQAQSVAATSTLAVIATIPVGGSPRGVAVDQQNDTVYVANSAGTTVSVINGLTGTLTSPITVGSNPYGVAVDQRNGTVYVTNFGSNNVSVITGATPSVTGTIPVGTNPVGVAVNQVNGTVYVTNYLSNNVSVITPATPPVTGTVTGTITVGTNPWGVAVNDVNGTVYVANLGTVTVSVITPAAPPVMGTVTGTITVGGDPRDVAVNQVNGTVYVIDSPFFNSVSVITPASTPSVTGTIPVGSSPHGVAVDQGDGTVYVANLLSNNLSVITPATPPVTGTVTGTITVGSGPYGVAVDDSGTNAGLVYVANFFSNTVSVIGRVSASLGSASALPGSTVRVNLEVPQVDYDVDYSTVTSVSFGGTLGTGLTAAPGDAWNVTVPAGSGTVPVTVTLNGGLTASAGSFTYPPPTPPPVVPPSAPVVPPSAPVVPPSAPASVTGLAGDASAVLSWTAPTSSGSSPISRYQAVVSPGGQSCLVAAPALTCTINGLTNGTTYTATVRAMNGTGWGPYSAASAAFTPQLPVVPSITITGSRTEVRGKPGVVVTGTTTGFGMGAILRPWIRFPGQPSARQGTISILVDVRGGFTWQRRTDKTIYISIRSQDGTVVSNRLILRETKPPKKRGDNPRDRAVRSLAVTLPR